jgi:predicted permease
MRHGDRLDSEIQHHLDLLAAEYESRGMPPEEARLAARRAFGAVEPMKERHRDQRGLRWLVDLGRDLRYALRTLGRAPGFTAGAVLSLGLGIGATAAIFGIVDAVLLRRLPVRAPEELVLFAVRLPGQTAAPGRAFSYDQHQMFRRSGALADVAASAPLRVSVDAGGIEEATVPGQLVSGNYYTMLGVGAAVGRLITPKDETESPEIAVLSHAYFQRRFGSDRSIVGRTVRVNGQPVTVVGVSAAGFSGTRPGAPADITVPLSMQPRVMPQVQDSWLRDPYQFWLELVGRLDPRVPQPRALAALNAGFQARLEELRKGGRVGPPGAALMFQPGARGTSDARTRYDGPLAVMMAIVVLLLIAACANVANLLLARALKRRREIAVCMSLGATRLRLGRQLLTESLVIAAAGGGAGVAIATFAAGLLRVQLAGEPLQHAVAQPDLRVLVFTAAVSLVTAIAFGLAPLLLVSRVAPQRVLNNQGERVSGSGLFGQGVLVVTQVAVSLVLLVGAGLFIRTLTNLRTMDLGFDQEEVLVLRLEPEGSNQKRESDGTFKSSLLRIYGGLLEGVESLPGVRSASLAGVTPLGDEDTNTRTRVRRAGATERNDDLQIRMIQVYPKYFSNQPAAADAAVRAVVINRTLAAQLFGGTMEAVGGRFGAGGMGRVFEVVGVVDDARDRGPREEVAGAAYATYAQTPTGRAQMTLFVRTAGGPRAIAAAVRGVAASVDPTMPLLAVQSIAERVAGSINQDRLVALLAAAFGGVALLLAAIGIYGVAAYAVACREKELGIRLALGATRGGILATVVGDSLRLVALGAAAGLLTAGAASRLVASRLFGVSPLDPATMLSALLILVGVAAVAALVPARRASRIAPLAALRSE